MVALRAALPVELKMVRMAGLYSDVADVREFCIVDGNVRSLITRNISSLVM